MREATPGENAAWQSWAEHKMKVRKPSGKPFKSGSKVNTIRRIGVHPISKQLAFEFYEDESQVECFRCMLDMPPGLSAS